MKVSSRVLRRIAFWAVALPAASALAAQLVIWGISGCDPNPYALGECMVGKLNLAGPLLLAVLGGVYVAFVLLVVFTGPLLVVSWVLDARSRKKVQHAG